MRVNNQTSDPVDYEQTGGDPPDPKALAGQEEACYQGGTLEPGESKDIVDPCEPPPYTVEFRTVDSKSPATYVKVSGITRKDAVVVLAALPVIVE
jgi:hypothetical protein